MPKSYELKIENQLRGTTRVIVCEARGVAGPTEKARETPGVRLPAPRRGGTGRITSCSAWTTVLGMATMSPQASG
jgi:hypothetical protein